MHHVKTFGETRWSSTSGGGNPTPTSLRFTGQREESIGLYFYQSRFYDPYIAQFSQPDSIIPDPNNPLDWNRYLYARYNPVRYIDPTGHMVDDGCSTQGCSSEWNPLYDRVRLSYLMSRILRGSGSNGKWLRKDWNYFYAHREKTIRNPSTWIKPDSETGWELFSLHAGRLASHYGADEKDQFVRDFGLLFGGISGGNSWAGAAIDAAGGPQLPWINEGNQGLAPEYLDSLGRAENQSHHYAGLFYLGYFSGSGNAKVVNIIRDIWDPQTRRFEVNPGDIFLGNVAASHGEAFRFADMSCISAYISWLLTR